MPCYKLEKSLDFRPRRDKTNDRDAMAPKAVRPRAIRYHGLFGMSLAAQHLIVDEKWTPNSLTDQFLNLTELLKRRVIYKRHETKANRLRLLAESRRLKSQCADGHIKLQKISSGNNAHKIRNFLSKHKDMQRLYQKMPIHLIADNINQRTFTMRKERDRLELRLSQLKHKYKELLLDRSEVQNLVRYENEYVLNEELQSRVLLKKIENSNVRFRAIRIINITYKKMIQVLLQDEIFYEPILRSLDSDMEDQSNFIKHILYLGMPAISRFRELNREFRRHEENSRKNLQAKLAILASLKKPLNIGPTQAKVREVTTADPRRYVRRTVSMEKLKTQLQSVEKTIKSLKLTALCSQAKEIYPRIKGQVENNVKLQRKIENDRQNHENLRCKMKYANVLEGVLLNNLSEEEINRLERIRHLQNILKTDEDFEQDTIDHIKNRSDAYVMMRMSLWNLSDILRHVDYNHKVFRSHYPNSYLKLPLLKFELLNMRAFAPDLFEEDVGKVMHSIKRKVYKLLKGFTEDMNEKIQHSIETYHTDFLATLGMEGSNEGELPDAAMIGDDLLPDKTLASIPNRKQIKAQSARLIEEMSKLDEM